MDARARECVEIRYQRGNREEADDLRRFFHAAPTACLMVDRDGVVWRVNPAAARLLAASAEELLGADFLGYLSPEHRTAFEYLLAAVFACRRAGEREFRVLAGVPPHERTVLVDASLSDSGRHCLLLLTDLTEYRRIGGALDELESYSVGVLNSLPWHIAVLDRDGVIRAVNTAWQRFAIENGAEWLALHSVGMRYRDACVALENERMTGRTDEAWAGIERVLHGETDRFTFEYACHLSHRSCRGAGSACLGGRPEVSARRMTRPDRRTLRVQS